MHATRRQAPDGRPEIGERLPRSRHFIRDKTLQAAFDQTF